MYLFWIVVYIVLLQYFPLNAFLSPLTIRKIRKEKRRGLREGDKERKRQLCMHVPLLLTQTFFSPVRLASLLILSAAAALIELILTNQGR